MRKFDVIVTIVMATAMGSATAHAHNCSSHDTKVMKQASATADIVDTAVAAGKFNTLVTAVKTAGLADALKGEGPFTVFAPTDEAFAKLPDGTVESLLEPENRAKLVEILKYHVVAGRVTSDKALEIGSAETLQSEKIKITVDEGQARVNNAKLVQTDIMTSNGVIHVIDTVLLPPKDMSRAE